MEDLCVWFSVWLNFLCRTFNFSLGSTKLKAPFCLETPIRGGRRAHGREEVVFRAGIVLAHLQVEQRRPCPHGFADLKVVLLSQEARRTLVVWWQHFDVNRGNGRPEARRQSRAENVSSQTGETLLRWME